MTSEELKSLQELFSLSNDDMATICGVGTRTVERWRSDDRKVRGPAKRILWILDNHPELVEEMLSPGPPENKYPRKKDGKISPTYVTWVSMKQRCHYEKHKHFRYYGGRGIMVCLRWRYSFDAFYEDMGERPEGTTIDRIDNNLGYQPGNCRWATKKEQGQNKLKQVVIKYHGREMRVAEIAKKTGVPVYNIYRWVRQGKDIDEMISAAHPNTDISKWKKYITRYH